jgi:hypothetical protein
LSAPGGIIDPAFFFGSFEARASASAAAAVAVFGIGYSRWSIFMPIIELCRLGNPAVIQAHACIFFYYETSD